MSTPTFKLPSGYATLTWGIPGFTEATTMLGAAIIKSMTYRNQLEMITIEGTSGFVAGWTEMVAGSNGSGGTKFDTEAVTIACVGGTHATKTWPVAGAVVTISAAAGQAAGLNGDWKVVAENDSYARKQDGEKGYDLKRWCDVDLTP